MLAMPVLAYGQNTELDFVEELNKRTSLMTAIQKGDLKAVKRSIDSGEDLNWQDEDGFNALFKAQRLFEVLQGNANADVYWRIIQLLRRSGAVYTQNKRECFKGTDQRRIEIKSDAKGCKVHYTKFDNTKVVAVAMHKLSVCVDVQKNIVKNLEANDFRCEHGLMHNYSRPDLVQAAGEGDIEKVKQLVSAGADVNMVDQKGFSSLFQAAMNRKEKVVAFLLSKEADPNIASSRGFTPLHGACERGYLNVAKILLNSGANVNAKHEYGWTPLHAAAYYGHLDLVKFLVGKGADIAAQERTGWNSVTAAKQGKHPQVVDFLEKSLEK
jgi:ankyrin repeat protein